MTTSSPVTVETMRAVLYHAYGPAEALTVGEAERPSLTADGVLVRVRWASLNRVDWYRMHGRPYVGRGQLGLRRPKSALLGVDFAGVVEAVGADVTDVQRGDEVFGGRSGSLAEWVNVSTGIARKPPNVPWQQAAAAPLAGLTALQGLRDKGKLSAGQRVLINGASGGVGTFAIQIAKALGGEVTAVVSTRHVGTARRLGADHVIDYTAEDFTRTGRRYDLVLDVAGSRPWSSLRRVLAPKATVVVVGGPTANCWIGPLSHVAKLHIAALLSRRSVTFYVANFNRPDMQSLADLLASGALTPVVEQQLDMEDIVAAMRLLGDGHADGKFVISI